MKCKKSVCIKISDDTMNDSIERWRKSSPQIMAYTVGIEPTTYGFGDRCSPN